jgi:hypothetical protein
MLAYNLIWRAIDTLDIQLPMCAPGLVSVF